MKEFWLVIQHGNAKPYSLWTFSTFEGCYSKMLEFIFYKKKSVRPEYYVLNDFYKNEYQPFLADITKYKIEVRDVNDWKILHEKEKSSRNDNKIINLF